MNAPNRTSSNNLTVRVTEDFVLNVGSWHHTIDQEGRPIAHITPPPTPMFKQVVDYLERKPLPSGEYVRLADEARAAAAVCLRWGSYLAVLADASRPLAPDIQDATVSQIIDHEMARMNIEISSAIQWWLNLKGSGERRYAALVSRALAYLPLGRKTVTRSPTGDVLRVSAAATMAAAVRNAWPPHLLERDLKLAESHGVRAIANTVTLLAWRNGPVENLHAGHSPGHALDERRVPSRDERTIMRQAQDVLYAALQATEHLTFDGVWPPDADRVLPFMRPFCHPKDWTYTGQSRVVELPLR